MEGRTQIVLAGLGITVLLFLRKLERAKCNIEAVSPSWREILSRKSSTTAVLVRRGYNTICIPKLKSFRLDKKIILPPTLFEEFRKLPDTVLSASAAFEDTIHIEYTLGHESHTVPSFIQQRLNSTAALSKHVPLMYEEVDDGLRRSILSSESKLRREKGKEEEGWIPIELLHATQSIISQVICRLLVGKTLSGDPKFTQKVADFSYSVILWSIILDWCPSVLRSWIAWLLPIEKTKATISGAIRRDILECLEKPRTSSQAPSLLQGLVEVSLAEDLDNAHSIDEIIRTATAQVPSITFGAIDPTTVAFSQVVLDLLSQPSSIYFVSLREEVKTVLAARGSTWSFEAIKDLKMMDSFIRESQRLHPIGVTLAARKVICKGGWTFQNGDHAPGGSLVSVPTYAVHRDENLYSNPDSFNGFRFKEKRSLKAQGDTFLAFGYGRHACSGRAFGLVIMKLLLVNLILDYDLKELPNRPGDKVLGNYLVPDLKTIVQVRKRQGS